MNRDEIIEKIATYRTDNCSTEDLMDYFYQGQIDFLDAMTYDELLDHIAEYELEEVLGA